MYAWEQRKRGAPVSIFGLKWPGPQQRNRETDAWSLVQRLRDWTLFPSFFIFSFIYWMGQHWPVTLFLSFSYMRASTHPEDDKENKRRKVLAGVTLLSHIGRPDHRNTGIRNLLKAVQLMCESRRQPVKRHSLYDSLDGAQKKRETYRHPWWVTIKWVAFPFFSSLFFH